MIGIGIWWMTKSVWGKAMGFLLPVATFVGITSTANHFILDAVGGAIVTATSLGFTALLLNTWANNPRRTSSVIPHDTT